MQPSTRKKKKSKQSTFDGAEHVLIDFLSSPSLLLVPARSLARFAFLLPSPTELSQNLPRADNDSAPYQSLLNFHQPAES